jgi:hypothetical protein
LSATYATNPHTIGEQPLMNATLPDFPLQPSSTVTKQAAKLHAKAVSATERLAEVEIARVDAVEAARLAQEALDREIIRGAGQGIRPEAEADLAAKLATMTNLASPHVQTLRRDSAIAAQHAAVTAFLTFCRENSAELLRGVRTEADAATSAYVEGQAAAEELLSAPTARRQAAGELVTALIPCLGDACYPYEADWSVPEDLALVPLPQAALEVIERARDTAAYDARRADEAEAARAAAEQAAVDLRDRDEAVHATGIELGHLIAKSHRGELSHSERESLARGEHPLQVQMERLSRGTLSQAQTALHDVELRGLRGHLSGADSAALARGAHPAQVAVERLTPVAV